MSAKSFTILGFFSVHFVFAAVWGKQGEVLHDERGVGDDWPSWTGIQKVRATAWHDVQLHNPLLINPVSAEASEEHQDWRQHEAQFEMSTF